MALTDKTNTLWSSSIWLISEKLFTARYLFKKYSALPLKFLLHFKLNIQIPCAFLKLVKNLSMKLEVNSNADFMPKS